MIIRENVHLSELTTMRLGGPARYLIDIETVDDIPQAFDFASERGLPVFILGGGANTIAHDAGWPGVIIRNNITGITISDTPSPATADDTSTTTAGPSQATTTLTAYGGTEWDVVVAYACDRGLTGIEALSKIPGLAGAAPVQNIGAYGQSISDTLASADIYDLESRKFKTLTSADFGFSYRRSALNATHKSRYFVVSITLALHRGQMSRPFYNSIEHYIETHSLTDFSPQSIRAIVSTIRAAKLPDPAITPSAGSFFKNIYLTPTAASAAEAQNYPVHHGHDGYKINSGWLIEQAGLKGQLLHGIRVCDTAALVLINESATSYADLAAARTEIIDAVKSKFGYTLEQEPVELPNLTATSDRPTTTSDKPTDRPSNQPTDKPTTGSTDTTTLTIRKETL